MTCAIAHHPNYVSLTTKHSPEVLYLHRCRYDNLACTPMSTDLTLTNKGGCCIVIYSH